MLGIHLDAALVYLFGRSYDNGFYWSEFVLVLNGKPLRFQSRRSRESA